MEAPAGAVLSTVVLAIVTLLPDDAFLSWGWRIPFLLSAVLVGLGLYVRLKVTESPLFEQEVITAVPAEKTRLPIIDVLRNNPTSVLLGIGAGLGAFALQALMATFALTIGVQAGCPAPPCSGCSPPDRSCRCSPYPPTPPCPTESAAAP